jgi:arginine decarboxylase
MSVLTMRSSADVLHAWTVADSLETYSIRDWGGGFIGINAKGHLEVSPAGEGNPTIDLKELVDDLCRRGIVTPLLIRFSDILKARIVELNECFRRAIGEYGYKGQYRGVYPIKVNQHRFLVEEICEYGKPYHYGLEAGSKPELLAVLAMLENEDALIICNGYKDEEYVETALLGSKLGRTIILVVEKKSELELIRTIAEKTGVKPLIGIRAKLSARGAGKWEESGGDRSKFGLSAREIVEAVAYMREHNLDAGFKLLHFHLGSQISAIRSVKNALREAGRMYIELVKMGLPLEYLDCGGGLGVDYDGSHTNFASSMNYTMQEYANDIVYSIMEMCDADGIPHPSLVTESGRAVVAHHAVLVVDVLGVGEATVPKLPERLPPDASHMVRNLEACYRDVSSKNLLEVYHDAIEYKEETLTAFNVGNISLEERVMADNFFWATCHKIMRIGRDLPRFPEELEGLERALADTFFCNFSMFQSLPDSWAVDQLFPIVPVQRLHEKPARRAVLADITCDSDGRIDRFIDLHDVKTTLPLHVMNGAPYHVGIFLVGAYQEILGDLHNLFGDTNTVHVSLDPDHGYKIRHVVAGDTVTDVLNYVSYNRNDLVARVRQSAEIALRKQRMTFEESRQLLRVYEDGLAGYTYLERD